MRLQTSYTKAPAIAAAIAVLMLAYLAVTVYAAEAAPGTPMSSLQDIATYALAIAGLVSLIVGVGWGLINRKKYDKLNETINDLQEVIDAKEMRIQEKILQYSELDARCKLHIKELERSTEILGETNIAVVSQNLQMKAILKLLRLEGKWAGNEEDVFNLHRTQG